MPEIAEIVTAVFDEAQWRAAIAQARDRASHFLAYDLSLQAVAEFPAILAFEHQAILALAGAGALTGALERYRQLERQGRLAGLEDHLAAEFSGLGGRLFKDLANRTTGAAQLENRLQSARAYEAGFKRLGNYYLAINAASMYLAAGQPDLAAEYAACAYAKAEAARPRDYWAAVTQAEAALILHDRADAAQKLRAAAAHGTGRLADLATTRRQLGWLAKLVGAPPAILDNLPGPRVLHWSAGFAGFGDALKFFGGQSVAACGPVLSGADLRVARQLLEAGVQEVNLVLPCEPDGLIAEQPELAAALMDVLRDKNVAMLTVTREGGAFEPAARALCEIESRGLALLRGQSLAVEPEFFSSPPAAAVPRQAHQRRSAHAIVFGDVRGFSKLAEPAQLRFLETVIGGFADVLARYPAEYAETAGDGLFIVLADVAAAAQCCFDLLDVLRPARIAAAGLPPHLGLRLSAHIGPLYRRLDRVIGRQKFCGTEVIRTARIEPVTRVGEVFVTEQFAAALASTRGDAFICEYVGLQPMAKGFGDCRMYSLRRLF